MVIMIFGLVIFFAVHMVSIFNDPWRNRMVATLGKLFWKGVYALVSLIGFVLMLWGYGLALQDSAVIYYPPFWFRHLSMLLMVPVFPLLLAAYFPGRIKSFVRHPMLVATIVWAFSHLLVNGRVVDVLLFGSFLIWAVLNLFSMRQRSQRPIPGVPAAKMNDVIVLVFGLALYGLFVVWLHELLIGVALR
jgi:uncharacterized membrane protein